MLGALFICFESTSFIAILSKKFSGFLEFTVDLVTIFIAAFRTEGKEDIVLVTHHCLSIHVLGL